MNVLNKSGMICARTQVFKTNVQIGNFYIINVPTFEFFINLILINSDFLDIRNWMTFYNMIFLYV